MKRYLLMTWKQYYRPPNLENWQGRSDVPPHSTFFQNIQRLDLNEVNSSMQGSLSFGLLGFCTDEGIRRNSGRIGAAQGPNALRQVLAKLPLHTRQRTVFDAGDIVCHNQDLEAAQAALGTAIAQLMANHITPIVIGGGHELAYGHYQGIAKSITKERLDIINCDAHFDMRPLLPKQQGSSGTPFLQIAKACKEAANPFYYHCIGIQQTGNTANLFETADQHHVNTLLAETIHDQPEKLPEFVNKILKTAEKIYLSLCLDVFAAAFAPGVSAPQAYGLTPMALMPILRTLAKSGKVVSYDIAELSPPLDKDHCTAKLAAHFVFEIIHHHKGK